MKLRFIGKQLGWTEGGKQNRISRNDEVSVPGDVPEWVFTQYAHKFEIIDGEPPIPQARVITARVATHTGGGWYTVTGMTGKYRRAEAEALARGDD